MANGEALEADSLAEWARQGKRRSPVWAQWWLDGCMRVAAFFALLICLRADEFTSAIRPVLQQNCGTCHNPANPKARVDFLKAETVKDMEPRRILWRDVATQLRNRTMPPGGVSKLSEEDRLRVATSPGPGRRRVSSIAWLAVYVEPRQSASNHQSRRPAICVGFAAGCWRG